jgi:SAM-dependent methyltransferase
MLVSLLLFPVTLYYFSPVIIIEGAFQGIVTGSFVMFGLQLVASMFPGRAFCLVCFLQRAGGIEYREPGGTAMNAGEPQSMFKGTAYYYSRYRPGYPEEFFSLVSDVFGLDGRGRLLDLGCGTGQIAVPFAGRFDEVIAIDPEPEMLAEARRVIAEAGAGNVTLVQGSSEDLPALKEALGLFRVVTMGSSFHWMDRAATLETLAHMVEPDGGIVIASAGSFWTAETEWGRAVKAVVQKWLGHERRAGSGTFSELPERHESVIDRSAFGPCRAHVITYSRTSTLDQVIGHLYSTSFCSPSLLGERREAFEAELSAVLAALCPGGDYTEDVRLEVLLGRRSGADG